MNQALRILLVSCSSNLILLTSTLSQATNPKYEVGVNAGTFIYQGDLTPSAIGSFKTPSLVVGINGSRRLNSRFALRLDVNIGRLKGDDAKYPNPEWRQQRAFNFSSAVKELTASLVFTPIGIDHKINPYLFTGLGVSFLKINRDYSAFNAEYFATEALSEDLAVDLAHKLPRAIPVIPVGVGIRYPLSNKFLVITEASYRIMSTDYLDGFSQAGNTARKDHYYKFSIGLNYVFGAGNKYGCPVIRQ